ncbi:hypothetical protein RMATCC62417_09308 [Rhizopus microsporus]|nr:hypothetical protein RMATCC62417_09308 [Rhizopus microsporus]
MSEGHQQPASSASEAGRQQQQQQGQQREKSFFEQFSGSIIQMIFFWIVMRMITGGFSKSSSPPPSPMQQPTPSDPVAASLQLRDYASVPDNIYYFPNPIIPDSDLPDAIVPLWQAGIPLDISIYISEEEYFTDYNKKPDIVASDINYGEPFEGKMFAIDIPTSKSVQHNGTIYAHIFAAQHHVPIDPRHPAHIPDAIVYQQHVLTKFYPQKSVTKQKNLLKKEDDQEEEQKEAKEDKPHQDEQKDTSSPFSILGNFTRQAPLVAHWQQNFTLSLVITPNNPIPKNGLKPPVLKYIPMNHQLLRDPQGKVGYFRPILFPNDFWQLRQNAFVVNESVSQLPLNIHIEPIAMWKFNTFAILDDSMKQQMNNPLGGMSAADADEIKRMFLETNPVLLVTTIAVSLLHSLFEMLAFKNDIAFWKKKSNSTGISVRTLLVNIFFQIVIFLYLVDNSQETSWMVLISQGVGLLIEIWKVLKALKYELVWTPGSLIPKLGQQSENSTTKEEDETSKYDAIAFKYLTWLAYPLLGGYAIYSLYYEQHKSWYSYVLKTLVEFVYMFGFITMLPQLYINYRLKSVAHMPWKTLMYKSLNTFIDDLFAFVIKMPTLHRLACLRDDIVFFVYLYQRHVYKVDPTRANEYGQVGEEKEDEKETKKNK